MKLALLALLALLGTACGGSSPQARAPEKSGVVEIPTAKAEPKAKADDTPAPSSNAQAYSGSDDEAEVDEGYDYAEPPPPVPIWGSAPGGASGGPDCDRAADCCLKVVTVNGGDPSLAQTCDSFRTAPSTTCATLLRSFSQVAPQIGIVCP